MCEDEWNEALKLKKIIVPVVVKDIEATAIPDSLAALSSFIYARPNVDNFDDAMDEMLHDLSSCADRVERHTHYFLKALHWRNKCIHYALHAARGDDGDESSMEDDEFLAMNLARSSRKDRGGSDETSSLSPPVTDERVAMMEDMNNFEFMKDAKATGRAEHLLLPGKFSCASFLWIC